MAISPNNADSYTDLGITLHYGGKSTEALLKLNQGVAIDPTHQRIWLTLGFVSSQLGNTEQARTALTTARELGADTNIGQYAAKMPGDLPWTRRPNSFGLIRLQSN